MDATESGLLAAILANHADDLPRLVYADFLDERGGPGDVERAEFIRVQVEIARICGERKLPPYSDEMAAALNEIQPLRDIELPLFNGHCDDWFPVPKGYYLNWHIRLSYMANDSRPSYTVTRGFISEVRCTLADWCGGDCGCQPDDQDGRDYLRGHDCQQCHGTGRTPGIGPEVMRRHPVEKVVLTDREPDDYGAEGGGRWYAFHHSSICSRPNEIPHFLRQHFPKDCDGRNRESVIDGLSAALIAWAKSQNQPRIVTSPVSVDFVAG